MHQQLKLTGSVSTQAAEVSPPQAVVQTGQAPSPSPSTVAVTPERVDQAISWYRSNKAKLLEQAFPIVLPGVTYRAKWTDSLERQIGIWETSTNRRESLTLAAAYIHCPLSKIRNSLNEQSAQKL